MSMNKTWAISSWISFLISADILSGVLSLHEFHNRAFCIPHSNDKVISERSRKMTFDGIVR
jgi:hypothetical protein